MAIGFTKLASEIFRAFATDGVAASGAHAPVKADIRTWGGELEAAAARVGLWLASVSGTNTITATTTPATSSNAAGQIVMLVPGTTNTGAVTLNVNSIGAVAVQTPDGDALAGGELIAGRVYPLVYTGSAFRMLTWPVLEGSATFNPGSLGDGAGETTTVTVTGAALGDYAQAAFSLDTSGITITAWVSATNTVSVRFQNESGGTLDIGSGTLRCRVSRA